MRRIAMVTQKGGAGKSTLAICLGVAAREAGETVALVDLDPMGFLTGWGNRRTGRDIMVLAASPGDLGDIMSQLEILGVTLVIIDTPAGETALADEAIAAAQLCLVPARPNIFDVAASQGTLQKLKHRDYSFVLNQCPPQRQAPRIQQGIDALAEMGVLLKPIVAARAEYQEAPRRGLGVTEFAASGAAAAEMRELWRAARDRIDGFSQRKSDAA